MRACLLALGAFVSIVSHARADESPFDAWARSVSLEGQWKGPTVETPIAVTRPTTSGPILRSAIAPVSVHGAVDMDLHRVQLALRALEDAHAGLAALQLPMPTPDGSLGGDGSFDVYFDPGTRDIQAAVDGPAFLSPYDGLRVYGLADARLAEHELSACMNQLLAEAALLALDPAESTVMRRASAWALTLQSTGELGCRGPVARLQGEPWRGLFEAETAETTGLFLATLSTRQDGGSSAFLLDTWQFARQDSRDRVTLRASPDVLEALLRGLENAQEDPDTLFVAFSVDRYFAGRKGLSHNAPPGPLRQLPEGLSVPVLARLGAPDLPKHVYAQHDLRPYGSAYAEVDTSGIGPGGSLRVWLRGDPYLRFALTAVRLDAKGKELGRVSAPPRSESSAYLPVLHTEGMASAIIVVTALPKPGHDVDDQKTPQRAGFKLIFDKASNEAPP